MIYFMFFAIVASFVAGALYGRKAEAAAAAEFKKIEAAAEAEYEKLKEKL